MGNDVVTNSLTKLLIAKYDVLYDGDCPQFAPESSINYQLYVVFSDQFEKAINVTPLKIGCADI